MDRILIVNLKRLGDVYSTAHLINMIHHSNPHAEISLLTYEESAQAAKNLKGVGGVYTIDRKHLITLKVSKIFSNALALEYLFESLKPLKESQWDTIINFSSDEPSALITSYLQTVPSGRKIGVQFDENRNINYSNDWEVTFNEFFSTTNNSPMTNIDAFAAMIGLTNSPLTSPLRLNDRHTANAKSTIERLLAKRAETSALGSIQTVGVQVFASTTSKQLREDELVSLCEYLASQQNLIPMLLIAPFDNERDFAQHINSRLTTKVVIAEADLLALASVIQALDFVITPDTVTKHIADLVQTPTLELSLGEAPLFKQGTRNPKSLILSTRVDRREFTPVEASGLSAQDVIKAFHILMDHNPIEAISTMSPEVTVYRPTLDHLGVSFRPIAGSFASITEANRLLGRYLLAKTFGSELGDEIIESTAMILNKESIKYSDLQKSGVTIVTRDLLATLRALIQSQESKNKARDFIACLERLMSNTDESYLSSIFVRNFKGRVENLATKKFEESIKDVEALLYELKSDLQKVLFVIKELEVIAQRLKGASINSSRITLKNNRVETN